MKNETRTAIVNQLAGSATPVALDGLVPSTCTAVDLAELRKDGLVQVSVNDNLENVVSLTAKGLATIPAGKSTTPAQHAVLEAIADAESGQLPIAGLYGMEDVKVNPSVILEMVSRGWVKVEHVEADGETPAGISVSLGGKDGKVGRTALDYPVRATAAKVAGAPRGTNGTVEHAPIPTTFTKTFKERTFNLHHVGDNKLTVDELGGKEFSSPTAAAQAIIMSVNGKKVSVNGWDWLGLNK